MVFAAVIPCCLLFFVPEKALASGSVHVPVGSWVYRALDRLEAEGLIKSGLLDSRPLTRSEVARLVREAEASARGPSHTNIMLGRLVREFPEYESSGQASYLKPVDFVNLRYLYSDGAPGFFNNNNKGDRFEEGSNYRVGFASHARVGNALTFYFNPELRYPDGSADRDIEIESVEAYASLTLYNVEVTAGRESLWWGPGRHGALLISSNPRPFDLVKITNPEPFLLPFVGLFRFTVFATRLEEGRHIPRPYLAGLRLELKPHPALQLGFSRTAMFGGEGRSVDLGTIWDVITARNENEHGEEPGNQLGAIDLKLTLPFEAQPIVLYGELGGEDEAGWLPSRTGYIAGIYLPRVFMVPDLALRAEYATNYIGAHVDYWYTHHIYKTGYTYHGSVIGHHMGTEAKDFYIEAEYRTKSAGNFRLAHDRESSGRGADKATKKSIGAFWELYIGDRSALRLAYVHENGDGEGSDDIDSRSFFSELEFSF